MPTQILPADGDYQNSLNPWSQIIDLKTGLSIASTSKVLDWAIDMFIDQAGTLQNTFLLGDPGNGVQNFSQALIDAVGGPSSGIDVSPEMLEFSLDGGANVDARKVVRSAQRSVVASRPQLIESGNDLWELYANMIIAHLNVTDVFFSDLMNGITGKVKPEKQLVSDQYGFITADGTLPFFGGLFYKNKPYNATYLGRAFATFVSSFDDAVGKQVVTIDSLADTFANCLLMIVKRVAGITGLAYHAHYFADTGDLSGASRQVNIGRVTSSDIEFVGATSGSDTFYVDDPFDFDPNSQALIIDGFVSTPDLSEMYNSAYLVGGEDLHNFPQGGKITGVVGQHSYGEGIAANAIHAIDPHAFQVRALVGVFVTEGVGGVYGVRDDGRFFLMSTGLFGVQSLDYDPTLNLVYAGTNRGVMCAPLREDGTTNPNDWKRLGGLDANIVKVQTFPGNPQAGGGLFALAKDTGAGLDGIYRYPQFDPTDSNSGTIIGSLASTLASVTGWDRTYPSADVTDIASPDPNIIYFLERNTPDAVWGMQLKLGQAPKVYLSTVPAEISGINSCNVYGVFLRTIGLPGFFKYPDPQDTTAAPIDNGNSSLHTTQGQIVTVNNVVPGGIINGRFVTYLALTSNGIFWTTDTTASGKGMKWHTANGQNAFDALNIQFAIASNQFIDPLTEQPISTIYASDGSDLHRTYTGGIWWRNLSHDKVDLSVVFAEVYKVRYNKYPDFSVTELPILNPNLPVGSDPDNPFGVDLRAFKIVRERDDTGEWFYYMINTEAGVTSRFATVVGEIAASYIIDSLVCSTELGLVTKKWLVEHSVPVTTLTLNSFFSSPQAKLRWLRPMQTALVTYKGEFVALDSNGNPVGVQYVDYNKKLFYCLQHTIAYDAATGVAKSTTYLSTELQKQRLTPDDLSADLTHYLKDLALRG